MDDRFDIVRLIGKGATGGVYEAICKKTGKRYSIRRFYDEDGNYRSGWEDEFLAVMQQLAQINHPNVLPVIEADLDEDGAYLISDYHPTAVLHRKYKLGMPLETFYRFVKDGLSALIALHDANIVHGRIHYASFMVCHSKNNEEFYVLKDYGLRRIAPLIQGIDPADTLPTHPVFITPEHFDDGYIDDRSDLYMFGQLCYFLLLGHHPIAQLSLEEAAEMHLSRNYPAVHHYRSEIPQPISDWVSWLTNVDPNNRPNNAEEAFNHFLSILSSKEPTPTNPKPLSAARVITNKPTGPRKLNFG